MSRVEFNQYIVADSEICHGQPTFRGTRVMVWQVLDMLAAGETIEEILEDYPSITRDHIQAAMTYAARVVGGERVVPAMPTRMEYEAAG